MATVLIAVQLVVAFSRTGSVTAVRMTKRRIVLYTEVPPGVVYSWLVQHCPAGYSVDDHDPTRGVVILSSRPTAFTWGFFYPAVVYANGTGTRVDFGIKSKVFQYGPLVTRAHRKAAHALAVLTHGRVHGG
ncbi:hypothetical protein ACTG9Q_26940 [Actinokineospora sp. 24-640]